MEIEYTLEVEPEIEAIRGSFASGDDEADRALEDALIARVDRGDVWAWACVRVIATFPGTDLRGESSWLGGCSYDSAQDFETSRFEIKDMATGEVTHRGYYDDMCDEARDNLIAKIKAVQRLGEVG